MISYLVIIQHYRWAWKTLFLEYAHTACFFVKQQTSNAWVLKEESWRPLERDGKDEKTQKFEFWTHECILKDTKSLYENAFKTVYSLSYG